MTKCPCFFISIAVPGVAIGVATVVYIVTYHLFLDIETKL